MKKAFKDFRAGQAAKKGLVVWVFNQSPVFSHTKPGSSEQVFQAKVFSVVDGKYGRHTILLAAPDDELEEIENGSEIRRITTGPFFNGNS